MYPSGRDGVYWMVPMGLLFGVFLPLPFWFGKYKAQWVVSARTRLTFT